MDGTVGEKEVANAGQIFTIDVLLAEMTKNDPWVSPYIDPLLRNLQRGTGMTSGTAGYGGYSSAVMQKKAERMRQYLMQQQMQASGWSAGLPYPHTVTATSGYGPAYHGAYPSVDAQVDATVSTSTPTVQEMKLERRKLDWRYWLLIICCSVCSIWPAWGPQLLAGPRPSVHAQAKHKPEKLLVLPTIRVTNVGWRYFRIDMKNGDQVHVAGERFVQDDILYIKTEKEIVYQVPYAEVASFTEEGWSSFPSEDCKNVR